MHESEAVTRGVRVKVQSRYEPERSHPLENHWFFSYMIRVTNEADEPVRLVSRHWVITDSGGRTQEVRGPGVVGQQPTLAPGQSFEYTSFCPLNSSFGTMHGSFRMDLIGRDDSFDAEIAPFALGQPHSIN